MKFETSSETYAGTRENMLFINRTVDSDLKKFFLSKNYGKDVEVWGFLPIIMPQSVYDNGFFNEIKKYKAKKKDVEFRLHIDFDKFVKASNQEALEMVMLKLIESIDIAQREFTKIKDFDFERFKSELTEFVKEKGWIN